MIFAVFGVHLAVNACNCYVHMRRLYVPILISMCLRKFCDVSSYPIAAAIFCTIVSTCVTPFVYNDQKQLFTRRSEPQV